MELSKKKIKQLVSASRMRKARVHLGLNGVTESVLQVFKKAFEGLVVKPRPNAEDCPLEVVRVKVHPLFTGNIEEAAETFARSNGSTFVAQDGEFLVFYKPFS